MSDVVMPQLGETVTEGTITKWFKKVGDRIEADELLFEVSTDKVDSEVTSPTAGYISEIKVPEGETVDVGVVLAVITSEAAASPAPTAAAPVTPVIEVPAPAPVAPPVVAAAPPSAPVVAAPAPVVPVAAAPGTADATDRVLSPVVRKLINENNLDPATIGGTGVGGRITREDVLDAIDSRGGNAPAGAPAPVAAVLVTPAPPPAPPAPPPAPAAPAPVAQSVVVEATAPAPAPVVSAAPAVVAPPTAVAAVPAVRVGGRDEVVPFSNIRRRTGEHMVMSLSTSPHAFIAIEVDYSNVDRVRAAKKDGFKADEGFSLTYMPFIARAVVDSTRKFPHVNASVAGDQLVVHHSVHLGVAVDLDFNGLMVPVVRDADGKRLRAIARNISDLASRARSKKLTPDDITGGTFTLSNAGPYGIDLMQSIINQPQVGILSITSVKKKPVVVELPDGTDSLAIRPMGMLGLSWDHRAFDGAYAASFLGEIKTQLESKDWSAEL